MTEQRKTVGALSQELLQKDPDTKDPIELQRAMHEEYIDNLIECVNTNKNKLHGDFFVVVITKVEPLMKNVTRNYFFARSSCPTPDYDQAVFWYHAQTEDLEYLWCIPDKETCLTFLENKHLVVPEEQHLLQHVIDYEDGSLFRLAKKLNKEQAASSLIET